MSQEELFKIWSEEAKAALGAKKFGTVLDLWKVVAQRKVTIVCTIMLLCYKSVQYFVCVCVYFFNLSGLVI